MKVGIDSVLLGAWTPFLQAKHILDIGTGTGVLALMMAQRSSAQIDAVEIETNAYIQAQENIKNSPFKNRIKCYNTAIQEFHNSEPYDLIISNPPYFEASLKSDSKSRNIARHNDDLSLSDLFSKTTQLLAPNGIFAFILPHSSLEKIKMAAKENKLYIKDITEVKGREHKAPNRILVCLQKEEVNMTTNILTIYSPTGGYTDAFQELTKDYYLPSIFR